MREKRQPGNSSGLGTSGTNSGGGECSDAEGFQKESGLELCCPEDRWGWVAGGSRLTTEFEQSLRIGRDS